MKQFLFIIAILVMVLLGIMTGYRNGYDTALAKFKADAEQLQGKQERLLKEMEMLKGQLAMTEIYQAREFEFTAYAYNRAYRDWETDRKSTRLNSSHRSLSRMPSSA